MTWKTHTLGGFALTGAIGTMIQMSPSQLPFVMGVGAISALIPDLDQPNSKASRYGINRLIAYPLNKFFGHRGFIHSPLLYLCLTLLLIAARSPMWLWLGFFSGTFSHLLLDTLNPTGIPWLWPYKKWFHLVDIRTNSAGEYAFLAVFGLVTATFLFKLIG